MKTFICVFQLMNTYFFNEYIFDRTIEYKLS